jgi:hypothetical protein
MSVGSLATTEDGVQLQAQDGPREDDKRPVTVVSSAREGTYNWESARGDKIPPDAGTSGRGDGPQLLLEFAGPGTDEVEIQYCEPFQINGGRCRWLPKDSWGFKDEWSISVRMPATTMPTEGGAKNCTLEDLGGVYRIRSATPGLGTHEVNLTTAVPVPDGYSTKTKSGAGDWNVDRYWSETITAAVVANQGEFNLYTFALEMFFIKRADCAEYWEDKAGKSEWISKKWKVAFKATRTSSGAGEIGGMLLSFRPGAT